MTTTRPIKIKNKKALVKAPLLRAHDDCTYAISRLVDARNEIDAVLRVIEMEMGIESRALYKKYDDN